MNVPDRVTIHLLQLDRYLNAIWSYHLQPILSTLPSLSSSSPPPHPIPKVCLTDRFIQDLQSSYHYLLETISKISWETDNERDSFRVIGKGSIVKSLFRNETYLTKDKSNKLNVSILWELMERIDEDLGDGLISYLNGCDDEVVYETIIKLYPPCCTSNKLSQLSYKFIPKSCELLILIYNKKLRDLSSIIQYPPLDYYHHVVDTLAINFKYLQLMLHLINGWQLSTDSLVSEIEGDTKLTDITVTLWVPLLDEIIKGGLVQYQQLIKIHLTSRNDTLESELNRHILILDKMIPSLLQFSSFHLEVSMRLNLIQSQLQVIKGLLNTLRMTEYLNTDDLSLMVFKDSLVLETKGDTNSNGWYPIKFQKSQTTLPDSLVSTIQPETKLTKEESYQLITLHHQPGFTWDPLQIKLRNGILSKCVTWDSDYQSIEPHLIVTTNQAVYPPHHEININLLLALNRISLIQPYPLTIHLIELMVERPHLATTYGYFIQQLQLDELVTLPNHILNEVLPIKLSDTTPILTRGYFQAIMSSLNPTNNIVDLPSHWIRVTKLLNELNSEFINDLLSFILYPLVSQFNTNLSQSLMPTVKLILTIINELPTTTFNVDLMILLIASKLFSSLVQLSQLYFKINPLNSNLVPSILNSIEKLVQCIVQSIHTIKMKSVPVSSPVKNPQFISILHNLYQSILKLTSENNNPDDNDNNGGIDKESQVNLMEFIQPIFNESEFQS